MNGMGKEGGANMKVRRGYIRKEKRRYARKVLKEQGLGYEGSHSLMKFCGPLH
jgi:hypothetical protein